MRGPDLSHPAFVRPYIDPKLRRLAGCFLDRFNNIAQADFFGLFQEALPEIVNPERLHVAHNSQRLATLRRSCLRRIESDFTIRW